MKKLLFGLVSLLLLAPYFQSCQHSSAEVVRSVPKSSTVITSDVITNLKNMGFTKCASVVTLNSLARKTYYAKLSLEYTSQQEIEMIMRENNFVSGPSSAYIGNITDEAANKMSINYEKVKRLITASGSGVRGQSNGAGAGVYGQSLSGNALQHS